MLSDADLKAFLEFYHFTAFSAEEELKIWSAYNFPGVLKTVGSEMYGASKLDQVLSHLSLDNCIEVKRRLSCGFHEVVAMLDKQSQLLLRSIFLRLIGDSEVDVYEPLFRNMNLILKGFAMDESGKKMAQFDELLFCILRKEREYASSSSHKLTWRIHYALLQQFKYFIDYFDSEYIHDQCVPLLFKLLVDNVTIPIKETIIETLCVYLKKMRRLENRLKLVRAMTDLRESPSFQNRLAFLHIVREMYNHFSHRFVRESVFDEVLETARDIVANVRVAFVAVSALLRKSLVRAVGLHQQQQQQQQLQIQQQAFAGVTARSRTTAANPVSMHTQSLAAAMSNLTRLNECLLALCSDQDRDVAAAAKAEMDRVGMMPPTGNTRGVTDSPDTLDGGVAFLSLRSSGGVDFGPSFQRYILSDGEAAEDRLREDMEDQLVAAEVQEDASSAGNGAAGGTRRRDDDGPGRSGKLLARSSTKLKPATTLIQQHRKSISGKSGGAQQRASGAAAVAGGTLPTSVSQRSSFSGKTSGHGSCTSLNLPAASGGAAQRSESLKRGKSAGIGGKPKSPPFPAASVGAAPRKTSTAAASFAESAAAASAAAAAAAAAGALQPGRKKSSLGSLLSAPAPAAPAPPAAKFQRPSGSGGAGGGSASPRATAANAFRPPPASTSLAPTAPAAIARRPSTSSASPIVVASATPIAKPPAANTVQPTAARRTSQLPPIPNDNGGIRRC
ncbi:Serine/threonine-protein phosphatase 4 regulatory subunit 4 [Entophlyctis luteolus]|nr:Serine/threonine-protein phosphatase 4 regulatory subunit 4 [Entophlyctis luteolus]